MTTYIEIAQTGNVRLLVVKGSCPDHVLVEAFERIVKRNSECNGDYRYDAYFELLRGYSKLLAEYTTVKALLLKLSVAVVWSDIVEIRKRGYKISTTDSESYAASLYAASRRVDNLITKARSKQKEMENLQTGTSTPEGFEEVLANLNFGLGFSVSENISLARYNEYRKILKAKAAAQTKNQPHG